MLHAKSCSITLEGLTFLERVTITLKSTNHLGTEPDHFQLEKILSGLYVVLMLQELH